ncbi:MAG: hypothetical protein QM708_12080 [Propioniciclava sp.]|uniref:hypothetical protein n=1 Tax=Propioniciclava sp. TaxID=2038686 RepID=UPI0039E5D47E
MALVIDPEKLVTLRPELSPAMAAIMLQGAIARAARIAPCIMSDAFPYGDAATSIILDALVRRFDGGSGVVTQQTAGMFSQSTDGRASMNLFTSQERADLAAMCAQSTARTLNTAPVGALNEWSRGRVNGALGAGPGGL